MKSLMSIMKDPRIVGAMGVAKELKLTEELGRAQFLSQGWQKGSTTCRCCHHWWTKFQNDISGLARQTPVILVWALRP